MRMHEVCRKFVSRGLCAVLAVCLLACSGHAQVRRRPRPSRGAKPAPARKTVILDTTGFWRLHYTLRKPAFRVGDRIESSELGYDTPLPDAGWTKTDFDDSGWRRCPGQPLPPIRSSWAVTFKKNVGFIHTHCSTASLALIAMRGKFKVVNPARCGNLKLDIEYRGGVVVYINGKELARGHLPEDGDIEALAEDYPIEAWLDADGRLLKADRGEKDPDRLRRWDLRIRKLEGITVPARMLRKGVNVLAIEIHRAAYPKEVIDKVKALPHTRNWAHHNWNTCGLRYCRLTARSSAGIVPNVSRPDGLQVWNSNPMAPDYDLDYGDPNEPLKPVRIVAARNGTFSGKVVVGDTKPLTGLRATVSDLRGPDGAMIPSSAATVRYASLIGANGESGAASHYRASPSRFDGLLDSPPQIVEVRRPKPSRASTALQRQGQPAERMGAVQPIWLTVRVPASAEPGAYKGVLTITAKGYRPIDVPIDLQVEQFVLPDTTDYRTVVDLVHSPESVAMQYGVAPWSDRHFALIAKSQKLLSRVGNCSMYVHLTAETNMGNAESIVRWIPKRGGGYDHDFSVFDRYLDTVIENMGPPKLVALYLWDYHLAKRKKVPVTSLDPATGKTGTIELPLPDTPAGAELWRPVAEHIMKRLAEHGLADAAMLGPIADTAPPKAVADQLMRLFGNVKWMRHGHSLRRNIHGYPIGYQAVVWSPKWPGDPLGKSMLGWNRADMVVQFMRSGEATPITIPRLLGEMNIIGRQRGFGRIGADFWPVVVNIDKRGRKTAKSIIGRFPDSTWRNLEWMTRFMFAPGPDGAVSTARYEMMCEGIQECEARIHIEKALAEGKLPADLAKRCRQALDERLRAIITALDNHQNSGLESLNGHSWWSSPGMVGSQWYLGSGWQQRSARLFALAGEVTKALGKEADGSHASR